MQDEYDHAVDDHKIPPMQIEGTPLVLSRLVRQRQPCTKYNPCEYVMIIDKRELLSFKEHMRHDHKDKWFEAMKDEK